ncbi:GIDE domain-containing protein [Halovenus salina]|uniref:RING-type E3 ubiquitin transferase n=1 Tax=Halovenus salina TaxID=1510225 RepID=A0ABD5W0U2_9EURY|nr:GIDE domain-containing protein [Halovenus salina]
MGCLADRKPDHRRRRSGCCRGQTFVEEPATAADRLFPDAGDVGAYVWQAGFLSSGAYTYDTARNEFRQRRKPFASGVESGQFGVKSDRQRLYVNLDWLRERYDAPTLSGLEVGNPRGNLSLPALVTRYLFDSRFICLRSTVGEVAVDTLTDVVDLYRDDIHMDEFFIDARGVPVGKSLFVHGEVRMQDGRPTVIGTDETPLFISDRGKDGLTRMLRWTAAKYGLALAVVLALAGVVLL